jgi:inositol oxygenase
VVKFYQEQHEKQTVASVIEKRKRFSSLNHAKMGVWDALELLNTLVDNSDPDTELSQIEHCLQTSEALRKDGQPRWLILTGKSKLEAFLMNNEIIDSYAVVKIFLSPFFI